ncbi:MAG: pentapeptide repeat-containing protein [Myxococcota bacterium]
MRAFLCTLAVWLGLATVSWAAEPPKLAEIEDPRRLQAIGRQAMEDGDTTLARNAFTARLDRIEFATYVPLRPPLDEALVAEAMGEFDLAAAKYREAVEIDPLYVVLILRIQSEHPEREALTAEVLETVRQRGEAARNGARNAKIYTTKSKGEPRYLIPTTTDEVVERARQGNISRYCYIEELDFTKVKGALPDEIILNRCVIGSIRGTSLAFGKLVISRSFVFGDAVFGKIFEGERHKSAAVQPATFRDMSFRETVFMGKAIFAAVEAGPGRAYFPLVVFEGEADFKGAEFAGVTDFRFASFGRGANFRFMRMTQPVYFGGTRYRANTVFSSVFSARQAYFNESTFEGAVNFDDCEFQQGATFESSRFGGPTSFGTTQVAETLNLSRAVFEDEVNVKEVHVGSLDALGTHFRDDAWFMDATIDGRSRFSLDEVTRHAVRENLDELLQIYRDYQGDEDAEEPITTQSSYGVTSLDDLSARIDRNIHFANTRFGGYTVFEAVQFGTQGLESVASFFNAQFLGETHFENTRWTGQADFTTIFGREVAFNNAHFDRSLILDDANVPGRVTLTDATFADDANLSFYGAEIASFEINPNQVDGKPGGHPHRLFYEACARGDIDASDNRIRRMRFDGVPENKVQQVCHDFVVDEFVTLKQSFGDRAMTGAEDEAYWWTRHYETMMAFRFGTLAQRASAALALILFEGAFGWGVQLVNLGFASAIVTVIFALLYRLLCPNTILVYDGQNIPIREVSFIGLCFVSLQSLIAINTGWDFGDDDHTFRYLNTIETLVGFVVLTFFVGAYTRMILA